MGRTFLWLLLMLAAATTLYFGDAVAGNGLLDLAL